MLDYYRDSVAIGAFIDMGKKKVLISCSSGNTGLNPMPHLSGKNYFDVSLYSGGGGVFRKSMSENWEGSGANKHIEFLLEKKIEDWVWLKVIKNRSLPMDAQFRH